MVSVQALLCTETSGPGGKCPVGDTRPVGTASASGLEHVHGAHHILPADGTLAHALAALGAGDHVATLEQDTVDDGIHADTAQAVILLVLQLQPLTI